MLTGSRSATASGKPGAPGGFDLARFQIDWAARVVT